MRIPDLLRLLALAALWGGSFLLYRIVAPALGALLAAEARVAIAGVVLLVWHATFGPPFEWRGRLVPLLVVGIFNSALPFTLFGVAALVLPASYLAIINATSPLFGALVARLWFGEALDAWRIVGVAAGLCGVAALVGLGPVVVDLRTIGACVACLVAAASYGLAGNYTKRQPRPVAPASMATGSQLAAALVLLPLLPVGGLPPTPGATVIAAAFVLAIACTSIAYLLYFRLIRDVGVTGALTVTFLVPPFSIAWAWAVLGEAPTPRMGVGLVLVAIATALVLRPKPARTS
jgi:drug/metabolite transporter (DMT)-like permease